MGWIKAVWTFMTSNLAIAGGSMLAVFYGVIKYQSGKIEDLEHEQKVRDKLEDIREKQEEYREEVLIDETDRFETRVKDNSTKSRRDRASGL